jgi:hypothetical protein
LVNIFGNGRYIFDPLLSSIKQIVGPAWADQTDLVIVYPSDLSLVKGYRLHNQNFIVSMLSDATAMGGDLYTITNVGGIVKQLWTVTTTVALKDYSDEVSNFFRWGDMTSLWVTMSTDGESFRSTTFSTSDIAVSG